MSNFKVVYRKTKRGSVIKVRDYFSPEFSATTQQEQKQKPQVEDAKFQYPKHLTSDEIKLGLENERLLPGKFQASRENSLEGYVAVTINGEDVHVLIQGRDCLNRAIHDDEVVIELLSQNEWKTKSGLVLLPETDADLEEVSENEIVNATEKLISISGASHIKPTGKIVAITKRVWRQYTGVLRRNQASLGRSITTTRSLFIPSDRRIPIIRIETRQYESLKNQRLVVAIDSWPRTSRYPLGHYVKSLGIIGDKDTENQVLLLEHDVPHLQFTEAVLNCLPPEGPKWTIPKEEINSRLDLRNIDVCSVDPPGCTDIDDALHFRKIDNEFCEVGVHIADVSYFVKTGTVLDKEAAHRGTTVYLSDRRIDMIPDLLSGNLCSLRQHEDRLAFSVIWKVRQANAEIVDELFTKSIINSKASLTYDQAQTMINEKSKGPLHESLKGLNKLAKKLKQRRLERGALVLARADEIRFVEVESETHERDTNLEIQHKKLVETNSMVEEFMLLANIAVANKLLSAFPEHALLRRHPKPSKTNFDDLIDSAAVKGFEIRPEDGKSLSLSLDKAKLPDNRYFNLMLRMIATRCMTPALYFCSGVLDPQLTSFNHFGLAADLYTHFTSPIRRYADLLVHRFLAAAIGSANVESSLMNKNHVQLLCDQINYRHRMAQLASRASLRLHTVLYIKSKRNLVDKGYVFFVRQNAIQILVPSIAYEFTYFLQPSELWKYDVTDRSQLHTGKNIKLRQFDKIKVHVSVTTKEDTRFSDKIQVKIIEPPIDNADGDSEVTPMEVIDSTRKPSELDLQMQEENVMKLLEQTRDAVKYSQLKKKIRLGSSGPEPQTPIIVMPGDVLEQYLSKEMTMLGPGLMKSDNKVVATKSGILNMRNKNLIWIDSHQKRYVAARGECVIGIVRTKGSYHVRVDINSADLAGLSLLAFEGANKRNKPNLNVGDLVYAKVLSASKHIETELVCVNSNGKRDGLGVIGDKGGSLMSLSIDTTRVLLAPQCDFLEKLGETYRYEIAVGMNGRVWINSRDPSAIVQVANELRMFDLK